MSYLSTALGLTAAMLLSAAAAPPEAEAASDGQVSFNISSEPLPHWGYVSTPNYVGSVYLFDGQYIFTLEGKYNNQYCVGTAGFTHGVDALNMSLRFREGGYNCSKPNGKVEHFKLYY